MEVNTPQTHLPIQSSGTVDEALGNVNGVGFRTAEGGESNAAGSLAETFDTFLMLLTSQLQNQDPLDPMESEQFTQQLVQFAGVEQSINTNKKLDQMIQLQTSNQLNSAVSYMGRTVEVITDQLMLSEGGAKISYGLDGNSANTVISIVDQAGRAVRTVSGETEIGRHEFAWDGRDASGNPLPDGVYNFSVVATDRDDQTVPTVTASVGKVTGVEIIDGAIQLNIGEMGLPLDTIFAVRDEVPQI